MKKVYCSFDIEGTGLDPAKDHIIEVGAVLFEIDKNNQIIFGEEFSQLVKPPIPIPPFIQDLTNIREADVADAPSWEEVLPRLKKFLGSHIIVGQNIQFDLSFLAANGLELKQGMVDTKELAQTFLPQAKYFNLEYLLRYFGISIVSHHRALADARSAASLLGHIISGFSSLSPEVQKKINQLLKKSGLVYKDLFKAGKKALLQLSTGDLGQRMLFDKFPGSQADVEAAKSGLDFSGLLKQKGNFLVKLSLPDFTFAALSDLLKQIEKEGGEGAVVSVGSQEEFIAAAELARREGWAILDKPEDYFCEERFNYLLALPKHSDKLTQFLIKLLIWKASKQAGDNLSSLSLAGEEYYFRNFVCGNFSLCGKHSNSDLDCELGRQLAYLEKKKKLLTLHQAWLEFGEAHKDNKFNRVIFWGVDALEDSVIQHNIHSLTLRLLRNDLSALYDPQSDSGFLTNASASIKKLCEKVLNEADLYFGLISIQLAEQDFSLSVRLLDEDFRASERFEKSRFSTGRLISLIDDLLEQIKEEKISDLELSNLAKKIEKHKKFLEEFFSEPKTGKIYWLDFYNGPIKLKSLDSKCFTAKGENLQSYFLLGGFASEIVEKYYEELFDTSETWEMSQHAKHPALEVFLPAGFPSPKKPNSHKAILDFLPKLLSGFAGRSLVLFNSQKSLELFYQSMNNGSIKTRLLVQKFTGHHWKNLEAYQNNDNSIWFLTFSNFFKRTKQLPSTSQLIIFRIPYEAPGIFEALYDADDIFEHYILPKTAAKMEQVIGRFINSGETNDKKKKLIFLDSRIIEGHNESLLDSCRSQFNADFIDFAPSEMEKLKEE